MTFGMVIRRQAVETVSPRLNETVRRVGAVRMVVGSRILDNGRRMSTQTEVKCKINYSPVS